MPVTANRGATGESARWRATLTLTPDDVRGLEASPLVVDEGRPGYIALPEVLAVRLDFATTPYADASSVGDLGVGFVTDFGGGFLPFLSADEVLAADEDRLVAAVAPGAFLSSLVVITTPEEAANGLPLVLSTLPEDDFSGSPGDSPITVAVEYRVVRLP